MVLCQSLSKLQSSFFRRKVYFLLYLGFCNILYHCDEKSQVCVQLVRILFSFLFSFCCDLRTFPSFKLSVSGVCFSLHDHFGDLLLLHWWQRQ